MDLHKTHWSEKNYLIFSDYLHSIAEEKYRVFNEKMIPCDYPMLGIRVPLLRKLAKEIAKGDWKSYLKLAKDTSHEEVMLQGMVIAIVSHKMNFTEVLRYITYYISKMQSWALIDTFCSDLKVFEQYQEEAYFFIIHYLKSKEEYQVRFAVVMLLNYYLDESHIRSIFALFDEVKHEGYYVKMAVAWAVSVAFAKMPEKTFSYLQQCQLPEWTYRKALQKIVESNRVNQQMKNKIIRIKQADKR